MNSILEEKNKKEAMSYFTKIEFRINENCKNWYNKKRKRVKKYFKNNEEN